MNMSQDKKPAPKNRFFFALGIASFFVILLTGLILLLDYPTIYKAVGATLLIGLYLAAFFYHPPEEKVDKFIKSSKTSSFMSGVGISFVLFIVLFFGGMVWAVWSA